VVEGILHNEPSPKTTGSDDARHEQHREDDQNGAPHTY
jgi:hypothetical protein